jgi:hypothetical protein
MRLPLQATALQNRIHHNDVARVDEQGQTMVERAVLMMPLNAVLMMPVNKMLYFWMI